MAAPTDELRTRWASPGDIPSLLLLINGYIVQKAIAQLVGRKIHIYGDRRGRAILLAPVAFPMDEWHGCEVNLESDLKELTDIASWASKRPPLVPHCDKPTPTQASSVPRWLASMSSSDGIPGWLEPLMPTPLTMQTPSESLLISRIWRRLFSTVNEQNEVVYAIGVHGALIELEKWIPGYTR
ncbi:hypothetical protein F5Y11DRAFT_343609 [Daldinia sp. FL1419]|nr:hypothetical protein F5Y11DRAFT_343609 [Daldinia sp. FL1419]